MKRLRSQTPLGAAAVDNADIPQWLTQWLASAALLQKTPFEYLAPRDSLLPSESLRTFSLDPQWIEAMLSGAYSVGRSLSSEAEQDAKTFPDAVAAALALAKMSSPGAMMGPVSGFLIRSDAVKGWPKLQAEAFDANDAPLPRIRWEALSPSVMVALFAGQMSRFSISEPAEGLHFGLAQQGQDTGLVNLRYITVPAGAPDHPAPGSQMDLSLAVKPDLRALNVLRVSELAGKISSALSAQKANQNPDGSDRGVTAAEFALQMIQGVQKVCFKQPH